MAKTNSEKNPVQFSGEMKTHDKRYGAHNACV